MKTFEYRSLQADVLYSARDNCYFGVVDVDESRITFDIENIYDLVSGFIIAVDEYYYLKEVL